MRHLLIFISLLSFSVITYAQRVANVCGEIDYFVPETQTTAEAKRVAILQARLKAIADEFGTVVTQTNTAAMHTTNGQTETNFNSYSENEVRGIWLNDTQEPLVALYYNNSNIIIHVEVCGKARELKRSSVEMQVKTYNNNIETAVFKNNDRFAVKFKAAANGYIALFLREDNTETVYIMLPYDGNGNAREVKSNHEYIFLSTQDPEYPYDEETILTTENAIENNTLIAVFSQKPFHILLSSMGEYVPEAENTKFQKWLHNLRVYDTTVQTEEIVLTIQK